MFQRMIINWKKIFAQFEDSTAIVHILYYFIQVFLEFFLVIGDLQLRSSAADFAPAATFCKYKFYFLFNISVSVLAV